LNCGPDFVGFGKSSVRRDPQRAHPFGQHPIRQSPFAVVAGDPVEQQALVVANKSRRETGVFVDSAQNFGSVCQARGQMNERAKFRPAAAARRPHRQPSDRASPSAQ